MPIPAMGVGFRWWAARVQHVQGGPRRTSASRWRASPAASTAALTSRATSSTTTVANQQRSLSAE
eukprot:1572679-Lingulodinium_polyedra.AAC.1